MPKLNWPIARLTLLAILFVGTTAAWAKLSATPKAAPPTGQPKTTKPLAAEVPLPNWQLVATKPLELDESQGGRSYRYQQNGTTLEIDLHQMVSDGNVSRYLFVHSPVRTANANLNVKFRPNVGYYGIVSAENKAYLSACINPRGDSTVTEQQFTHNRYAHDLRPGRLIPWLLGQESLIDYRCLWTLMSVPINAKPTTASTERAALEAKAYEQLETTWLDWQQWWRSNFPPS